MRSKRLRALEFCPSRKLGQAAARPHSYFFISQRARNPGGGGDRRCERSDQRGRLARCAPLSHFGRRALRLRFVKAKARELDLGGRGARRLPDNKSTRRPCTTVAHTA